MKSGRDVLVLCTLHGLASHFGKMYSFPSQGKLLQLIESRYGIEISRRTLNRWLREMESGGKITRTRRLRRGRYGIEFRSTLYEIRIAGYRILQKCGVKVGGCIGYLKKVLNLAGDGNNNQGPVGPRKCDLVSVGSVLGDILQSLRC